MRASCREVAGVTYPSTLSLETADTLALYGVYGVTPLYARTRSFTPYAYRVRTYTSTTAACSTHVGLILLRSYHVPHHTLLIRQEWRCHPSAYICFKIQIRTPERDVEKCSRFRM